MSNKMLYINRFVHDSVIVEACILTLGLELVVKEKYYHINTLIVVTDFLHFIVHGLY